MGRILAYFLAATIAITMLVSQSAGQQFASGVWGGTVNFLRAGASAVTTEGEKAKPGPAESPRSTARG